MSCADSLPDDPAFPVEMVGLYWHFVDIVWIVIFTVVYLIPTPHPGRGRRERSIRHAPERAADARSAHAEHHPSAKRVRARRDRSCARSPASRCG